MFQPVLQRDFLPCNLLCSYFIWKKWRDREEEMQRRRKGNRSVGAEKSKKERDHRVFVHDSLSYGINGGLMGYERMFYWKQ